MGVIVCRSLVPRPSLIEVALSRTDYADTYYSEFATSRDLAPVDAARAFFRSFPFWVIVLLRIRNAIAALAGLKTGNGAVLEEHLSRFTGSRGECVVGFEVFDSSSRELLMGADDRHLDFRLSFFLERIGRGYSISAATAVKFNGWLGRAYFLPVKPLHRVIMPAILERMTRDHLGDVEHA
ncbi:MAG TPA: DUF2867 domain-containing protein [Spirochaetota bacterium]|nr:DUF2867 domain-containing protein [Spirochaetota bacterium]